MGAVQAAATTVGGRVKVVVTAEGRRAGSEAGARGEAGEVEVRVSAVQEAMKAAVATAVVGMAGGRMAAPSVVACEEVEELAAAREQGRVAGAMAVEEAVAASGETTLGYVEVDRAMASLVAHEVRWLRVEAARLVASAVAASAVQLVVCRVGPVRAVASMGAAPRVGVWPAVAAMEPGAEVAAATAQGKQVVALSEGSRAAGAREETRVDA